jgi:hypothetical protein
MFKYLIKFSDQIWDGIMVDAISDGAKINIKIVVLD